MLHMYATHVCYTCMLHMYAAHSLRFLLLGAEYFFNKFPCIHCVGCVCLSLGHSDAVIAVKFSPDGR